MHVVEVVGLFALIVASFVFGAIYGRYIASEAVKFETAVKVAAEKRLAEAVSEVKKAL